jgi:hypothetical protein
MVGVGGRGLGEDSEEGCLHVKARRQRGTTGGAAGLGFDVTGAGIFFSNKFCCFFYKVAISLFFLFCCFFYKVAIAVFSIKWQLYKVAVSSIMVPIYL